MLMSDSLPEMLCEVTATRDELSEEEVRAHESVEAEEEVEVDGLNVGGVWLEMESARRGHVYAKSEAADGCGVLKLMVR